MLLTCIISVRIRVWELIVDEMVRLLNMCMTNKFNNRIRIKAKKKFLVDLLGNKCNCCGKSFPIYDLHHINPNIKDFEIGNKDFRISSLIRESEKCVLLCRNCHREIHSIFNTIKETDKQKIKRNMLDYINIHKCTKCGYSKNISALDFHHVDPKDKKFNLSDATIEQAGMISKGELTIGLKNELMKCTVLCAQCHGELHYDFSFDIENRDLIEERAKKMREIQPKIDRELVRSKFNSGMREIDIARELKASKGTISDILKSLGLTIPKKERKEKAIIKKKTKKEEVMIKSRNKRKFDPSIEEAIELKSKLSYRAIGLLYGVSQVAVYNRFVKMFGKSDNAVNNSMIKSDVF